VRQKPPQPVILSHVGEAPIVGAGRDLGLASLMGRTPPQPLRSSWVGPGRDQKWRDMSGHTHGLVAGPGISSHHPALPTDFPMLLFHLP
jgi:hypothetical protein